MAVRAFLATYVAGLLVFGCGSGSAPSPKAAQATREDGAAATIAVERKDARPGMVRVVREGDPRPAVALVVGTNGGSSAAVGLAALVEARLQKAGFNVDSRADRDSFRVRALVETPARAAEFVTAARAALAAPVTPGLPEFALIGRRIASLRRHPIEAPIAHAVARCTGELGMLPSDVAIDVASAEGAAQLEAARTAAYGATQVSLAAVGNHAFVEAAASSLYRGDAWPKGPVADARPASEDQVGAFFSSDRAPGSARIAVTMPTLGADSAPAAARHLGESDGPLGSRLRGLPVPFRVVEARASVRPRGGCLSVVLETTRATPGAAFEEGAALAANIALRELRLATSAPRGGGTDPGGSVWPIGPGGRTAVRLASDPREAAELAGLWSLSETIAPETKIGTTVALALPLTAADAREGNPESAAQPISRRFAAATERLGGPPISPVSERAGRLERGQGELWLVLASSCGALAEASTDPGLTALSLFAALAAQPRSANGVWLEPWVAPDAVGVVAHGARGPNETLTAFTSRVAEEAARVFIAAPFAAPSLATARALLLNRVGDSVAPEGRAMSALANALVPGHPSWLAPLGAWEELANAGADAASTRWTALSTGPLRLAVLANESDEQIELAGRTVDRWLTRGPEGPRACAPVEPPGPAKSGTVQIAVAASSIAATQALVGFPIAGPGTPEGVFAELTLAGLSGADGWLMRALSGAAPGATAQARWVGGSRAAAIIIDVRAPEAAIEPAIAQIRALFQRLKQGALSSADFERSQALTEKWQVEASLDPRRRLIALWRTPNPAAQAALAPSLETWRSFAASALSDEKLVVVIAKPKR